MRGLFMDIFGLLQTETLAFAQFKSLGIFTLILVCYSLFIFYFYRFLARKNVVSLDLKQYNKYQFGAIYRMFAVLFFIIEYLFILPFVTFFWFGVLSIIVLLVAQGLEIHQILLLSAALIGTIRITSFVSEDLARDLAKMVPLALLGFSLTTPSFFQIDAVLAKISLVPSLLIGTTGFLVFIVSVEIVMRVIDATSGIFRNNSDDEESD
jgi:hypothetical protein